MPPKPKKRKSPKGTKKSIILLDEIDTSVLTREKLEKFCVDVHAELTKEKQHSDFLKLERDKLANMLAIAREQLTTVRNSNLAKEHELEETKEKHRHIIDATRQQLINLVSDKSTECLDIKQESLAKMNYMQTCHGEIITQLTSDIKELKNRRPVLEHHFSAERKEEEIEQAENKYQLRQTEKDLHVVVESDREKFVSNEMKNLEYKFAEEYKMLEKRKDNDIALLIKCHSQSTNDLKHYYNKVVNHNMSIIMTMKASLQELKAGTAATEKQFSQLRVENNELITTLNQSQVEEEELNQKLVSSKRDQTELKYTKLEVEKQNNIVENMKWELETLNIRLDRQGTVVSETTDKTLETMFTMRARVVELVVVMEHMLTHLHYRLNEADATLNRLRSICAREGKWKKVLDSIPATAPDDTSVDNLNYQLATVAQNRDRVISAYTETLKKYDIHTDDTGFVPLDVNDILKGTTSLRFFVNEDELYCKSSYNSK